MRSSLLVLAALAIPTVAPAQRVMADISIYDGPVAGRIIVGHPGYGYPRHTDYPRYHAVPVYRTDRRHEWFRHHGFRVARIWYDGDHDRYYDNVHGPRAHLREVVVYERDGRYYRDDWRDDDRD